MLSSSNITSYLTELLYRLPAVLVALSFHEWAYAYAAYRLGDPTARNLGRMTVNPFKHIDPIGFVMMILFRFGWAKPVPINPRNFKHGRRDLVIVSLAGVTMNLILAFVFMGLMYIFALFIPTTSTVVNSLIEYMYFINIALFVFNLLPIPPLDGYHVVEALLIRKVGPKVFAFLERYGSIILIVLLLTGVLSSFMSTVVYAIMSGMSKLYSALFSLFV